MEIHHHYTTINQIDVSEILSKLDLLTKQNVEIMTRQERMNAGLDRIDEATNNVAADLRRLKDEIEAGNVSNESLDRLDRNATLLESIASETPEPGTPENPNPNPEPDPGNGEGPTT
jgi:vacuolar-type H+-ATPase subunit I/STV1